MVRGRFTDLTTAVEAVLAPVPPASPLGAAALSVAVFGDPDGDGVPDVLVGTLEDGASARSFRYDAASGALVVHAVAGLPATATVRGIVDLDGDGRDDVLAGTTPGADQSSSLVVRWGGDAGYVPLAPSTAGNSRQALTLDDVDRDGWLDLLLGAGGADCSQHSMVRALLQTGPRTFVERAGLVAAYGKIDDGVIVTGPLGGARVVGVIGAPNACTPAPPLFYAEGPVDTDGYPTFGATAMAALPTGGPMGATLADLDQDGFFDLAVALDPIVAMWRGGATAPLGTVPNAGGLASFVGHLGVLEKPWAMAFADLDLDGMPDAIVTHGNHVIAPTELPIGLQWTSVHLHGAGGFCFSEVDGALGLGREGDWRTLAVGDLDADGDADFAVGGRGISARVYRNDLDTGRHGMSLRFAGTTSNALGIGAEVEVRRTPTATAQHFLVGGYAPPIVVTTPLVFVGLADATAADTVTVRWPSGVVQVLHGLAAGAMHTITEPRVLAVEPAARHLPAGGAGHARLRVRPGDAPDAWSAGAQVTFRIVAGGGTLGAPTVVDHETVVELTPPASAGSTVLEVLVDGVPLGVRPRLWWD